MLQQISCPRCQTPLTVDIFQVIDVQRNPERKYALLNGQLNTFSCPNCGLTGQVASPLLFHDAESELLAVYVPMEMNLPHLEQERLIGRMVKELMDKTPAEQRRGYMLQPQTIINFQSFIEKVLETEGITPEMIARQRKQAELVDTLAQADDEVVGILLRERGDEIDETFFALVQNAMQAAEQQRNSARMVGLTNLRARLYTETEVGRRLEKREIALRSFEQEAKRENGLTPALLLKHILANVDDEGTVRSLAMAGQSALDYSFFVLLTEEVEKAARRKDKETSKKLTGIRRILLDMQKALNEASEELMNRANATLSTLLAADDKRAAIREHASELDEAFMYLLSARLEAAERQDQAAEIARLTQIYDLIVDEAEQQTPPEIRLVNRLLQAETDTELRQLLDENAELVTPQLGQVLAAVSRELGPDTPAELRDRLRRAQAIVEMRAG